MTTFVEPQTGVLPYHLREFHPFESAGTKFLYLVPSGAIYALDKIGTEIVDALSEQPYAKEELAATLARRGGFRANDVAVALSELEQSEVISFGGHVNQQPRLPDRSFPLQRIVLNVTNQCNLACGYCL